MSDGRNPALPLQGTRTFGSSSAELRSFVKSMILKGVRTSLPVEVVAVTNEGGVSPIGRVDVRPLVQQIDGEGTTISHEVIYDVPYLRIQGGGNAVIIDPQVGDIGLASFSDRDISSVKANQSESPPGSARTWDMSDAVYHSCILSSSAPTQYIQFNDSGVTVHSPSSVTVRAPDVTIDADSVTVNGMTIFTDDVQFNAGMTNQGADISLNHTHGGIEPGSGTSGAVNS